MRSMALSGRYRSVRYRRERVTALWMASSVMQTPWCRSYRSRSPRRMPSASSGEGSSTRMLWNRRSRAPSFSMVRRNSPMVVAPISWSSPRASWGLRMLAASTAPSAAPMPMMVWSSSINRMTSPAAMTSSMVARIRSSKSPRYLVPATMEVMSRLTTRQLRSWEGTLPWATRWASPSTMAVLPTPVSPMRQGLFLVRRERIWMTRWISLSRPMTGSSRPARASSVRSRPYLSRLPGRAGGRAGALGGLGRLRSWFRSVVSTPRSSRSRAATSRQLCSSSRWAALSCSWMAESRMCSVPAMVWPLSRASIRAFSRMCLQWVVKSLGERAESTPLPTVSRTWASRSP